MMVVNSWGVGISFDVAVILMDDQIRERLHEEIAPCTEQEFFDAYAKAHEEAFGEWELDKENPCF